MHTTTRCSVALTALLCGSTLAAPPAQPAKTVNLTDLDFNSRSAVNTLYRRIERAAFEVCQMPERTRQLSVESGIKACRADAIHRAVLQANLPALTDLYVARTGRQPDPARYAKIPD